MYGFVSFPLKIVLLGAVVVWDATRFLVTLQQNNTDHGGG